MQEILQRQRRFFESGQTRSIAFRRAQLERLRQAIKRYENAIMEALQKDLGKSPFESYASEIGMVLAELRYASKHLAKWARPCRVGVPFTHFPASGKIYREPYGVSLVIAPWNYPFQLITAPLVNAIAAGNCIVCKPSEFAPRTAAVFQEMIQQAFPADYIQVVCGGPEVSEALLEQPFDLIFFTGSPRVGKRVMCAASQHLTPVVLELGGKSPCIVDETADIPCAARRIVWGKFLNAGQTCVAPDYLLVHRSVQKALVEEMKQAIRRGYTDQPLQCRDYPNILQPGHLDKLRRWMEDGMVLCGGKVDTATQKMEPTLLGNVSWESPVMQQEIFGPLLPVLTFDTLEETVEQIRRRPHPLALYLFSRNKRTVRWLTQTVTYGGCCVNDTLMHMTLPQLPFGGVGRSGMGAYHGKAGFEAFSRPKSILRRGLHPDIPLRYPPYEGKLAQLKKMLW